MENIMENVYTEENLKEVTDNVVELYPQEATSNLAEYMKVGGVCVAVVGVGYLTYKYAIKPALAKRKAKKAEAEQDVEVVAEYDSADVVEDEKN